MCGRFSVDSRANKIVSNLFSTRFEAETNADLRPTQNVSTIIKLNTYQQMEAQWGIKPNWSKKLIINAQSETARTKPTFKQAFQYQRCLVPCNGWFEWKTENGKKVKYFFEHADKSPLYMAGILFQHEVTELVTMTTTPNATCAQYHKRMPVFVEDNQVDYWFEAEPDALTPLCEPLNENTISISTE